MVAELTSITTSSAGGKTSVNSLGRVRSASKLRKRPKWIQTATREPIYSVLDSNETTTRSYPPGFKDNVVVISAVKSRRDSSRGKFKSKLIPDEQRELPYVWLPPENNNNVPDSPTLEVEDEYALYSVVKKPKKVAPASKSSCAKKFLQQKNTTEDKEIRCGIASQEEAFSEKVSPRLRLTNEQEDRRGQGRNRQVEKGEAEILSRQEALRKWLQFASSQLPEPSRLFDFSEMYENEVEDVERVQADWKRSIAMPRGVVGLVGPYRIYQNPNERREYMLQEEELVEEIVDSVNGDVVRENPVASENREENRQRAKWNIRENDEENLVPEIRGRADLEDRKLETSFKEKDAQSMSDWKNDDTTDTEKNEWKGDVDSRIVEGILSGKEERAIDVPDGASATSTASPTVQREMQMRGHEEKSDAELRESRSTLLAAAELSASNEHHDKDSLNETGSTTGGTVEGGPAGSPSRGDRTNENDPSAAQTSSSSALPPKSLVSRILARARSSDDLLDHSEPFSQLWIVLSNVYGELVVVLMMALCLAEVMDTPVPLLSLQGAFLMYLYVGSIAVIISIYVWVLVDSCGSLSGRGAGIDDAELGGASLTRFGSLKKAHISRARTAPTSFYIRVGALLFGLATLVFNGLEMAMHTMMQGAECLSDVVFVHPVLHGLFTFLQMHFLFVNSQVLVERFGLAARFGFTHLAATNIAVWARLVIWDSAQEWTYYVHLAQRGLQTSASPLNLRGFPGSLTRQSRDIVDDVVSTEASVFRPYQPISDEQISQVVALQECINTNTLGQLWTSSMPFLYPFIVQFSLIAAAVTFVMGQNVGKSRHSFHSKQKFHSTKDLTSNTRVGCDGSSKGLFLGILCMVAGIVVILIFLVVREDDNFPPTTLSWLTCGTLIAILTLSILMTASGLVQIRQMSVVTRAPAALDGLLTNVALFGVELYSVFTIVVCTCSLVTLDEEELRGRYTMLLSVSILQLVQSFAQSTLIAEASKRSCITRFQMVAKPGRQVITFLLFSNAVLWAFDTVVTQNWLSQELQLRFFGVLAWGVLSRIGLPLLIFYRFHSCVLLLEAWNKCYRTPRGEHPLN